jgi:exopolysaccharide biosynthesis polyprenyl glycosylphosphotransferase
MTAKQLRDMAISARKLPIELPDQPRSPTHWQGGTVLVHRVAAADFVDLSNYQVRNIARRDLWVANLRQPSPRATKIAKQVAAESAQRQAASIPTKVEKQARIESVQRQHSGYANLNDTLPKHRFLKQLRLEKRRTERSKVPLSIVLFRGDSQNRDELGDVRELLDIVHSSKRETDILGYLAEDLVALLLPDTTEQGTQAFTQKINRQVSALHFSTIAVTYPHQLLEHVPTEHQDPVNSYPFFLGDPELGRFGKFLKRSLDIVGSVVGIVVLSPWMLLIAAAIKTTSPGSVIFKQTRLGKRGVPFVFYKFRSMSANADDRIHREYVASLISGNHEGINQGNTAKPLYKLKSDPRVTPVGRFIRKTSIDELPQLFNVLKGDMSLVGPRPPIPYEADKYEPWHLRRILEIKPGITGLWQVEGRSKTSFDDMVRLDLRYIRNCSLMFDLKILLRTVKVVLKREGAT